jgi:hypothetical protein
MGTVYGCLHSRCRTLLQWQYYHTKPHMEDGKSPLIKISGYTFPRSTLIAIDCFSKQSADARTKTRLTSAGVKARKAISTASFASAYMHCGKELYTMKANGPTRREPQTICRPPGAAKSMTERSP